MQKPTITCLLFIVKTPPPFSIPLSIRNNLKQEKFDKNWKFYFWTFNLKFPLFIALWKQLFKIQEKNYTLQRDASIYMYII